MLAFIPLAGWTGAAQPHRVWVNPERIAYLEERITYHGHDRTPGVVGTRIFFAEDGMLDVRELPEVVLKRLAVAPSNGLVGQATS
jgi:hypothetical protein